MKTEIMEVNNIKYILKIFTEKRNNITYSISGTSVNIHIPDTISRDERYIKIFKIKSWVRQKILENPKKFKPEKPKEYIDGQNITIGNKNYILNLNFKEKESSSARIIENIIYLNISSNLGKADKSKHISTLLSRCIAKKRLPELQERLRTLNEKHFNQKIKKIFFKYNKSNWGSCSTRGNINISTRLLFAPNEVLDYICIHELAHLVEHNHSEKFWALVEKAMPNYNEKEKWLKEHSGECKF